MSEPVAPAALVPRREMRTDIQALRGIAILFALLYHAFPAHVRAGYLGVDVFFVVSGYLMTRLLAKEITEGTFSFRAFYFRRAKRILPAAYVTLAFTALLSGFFLTTTERIDLAKQLIGGITFSTNFVLWKTIDYFSLPAENKPLLHFWSLAIEEQFYLGLPAFLVLLPRRFWLRGVAIVGAASLVACFLLVKVDGPAAFYLIPTRDWELTIGVFGALCGVTFGGRAKTPLVALALGVLLVVPIRPIDTVHPRWDALLVCVATVVILLAKHESFESSMIAKGLAFIGDFSYSLYLVHWPLLAFANNAWIGPVPFRVRLALLCASFPLAWLLYRTVELPLWRAPIAASRRSFAWIAASTAALAITALLVAQVRTSPVDYAEMRRRNFGLSGDCAYTSRFQPLAQCRSSASPRILVWGDSFAMHLVGGIDASTSAGVVQATKGRCGPVLGLAPYEGIENGERWGRGCIEFNDAVLEHLRNEPSIDTVVLSSMFGWYADPGANGKPARLLRRRGGDFALEPVALDSSADALAETVARIRALGKRVVIVAPPPASGILDIGECLERRALNLPLYGRKRGDCAVSIDAYRWASRGVRQLLDRVGTRSEVRVFRFDPWLCKDGWCRTEIDGTFLYLDNSHLTNEGTVLLGRKIGLGEQLLRLAK